MPEVENGVYFWTPYTGEIQNLEIAEGKERISYINPTLETLKIVASRHEFPLKEFMQMMLTTPGDVRSVLIDARKYRESHK